eukprot:TRINITY_DN83608_c0_g1_i1.p1 TRINITY_DN83608_c0_g1~~TRINITY_DN83608_c0_g1_i1.p1  ORF type:complete len:200 (-),score=20.00 TRINITY_DN83608_c0_g1_i1:49-606(-)
MGQAVARQNELGNTSDCIELILILILCLRRSNSLVPDLIKVVADYALDIAAIWQISRSTTEAVPSLVFSSRHPPTIRIMLSESSNGYFHFDVADHCKTSIVWSGSGSCVPHENSISTVQPLLGLPARLSFGYWEVVRTVNSVVIRNRLHDYPDRHILTLRMDASASFVSSGGNTLHISGNGFVLR